MNWNTLRWSGWTGILLQFSKCSQSKKNSICGTVRLQQNMCNICDLITRIHRFQWQIFNKSIDQFVKFYGLPQKVLLILSCPIYEVNWGIFFDYLMYKTVCHSVYLRSKTLDIIDSRTLLKCGHGPDFVVRKLPADDPQVRILPVPNGVRYLP